MDLTMCETIADFRLIRTFSDVNLIDLDEVIITKNLLTNFENNFSELIRKVETIDGLKFKVKED